MLAVNEEAKLWHEARKSVGARCEGEGEKI